MLKNIEVRRDFDGYNQALSDCYTAIKPEWDKMIKELETINKNIIEFTLGKCKSNHKDITFEEVCNLECPVCLQQNGVGD